jgi:hypothetical protein
VDRRKEELAQFWESLQTGGTRRLKEYWKTGAGGRKIRWGTPGDLTRCHRAVRQEVPVTDMSDDDIWGYCNNLHKELFGRANPRD